MLEYERKIHIEEMKQNEIRQSANDAKRLVNES